jgi:S1-C subfamily serine protease
MQKDGGTSPIDRNAASPTIEALLQWLPAKRTRGAPRRPRSAPPRTRNSTAAGDEEEMLEPVEGVHSANIIKEKGRSYGISVFNAVHSSWGLGRIPGCKVAGVAADGLAASYGLKVGDNLLSIDGEKCTSSKILYKTLNEQVDGASLFFKWHRSFEGDPLAVRRLLKCGPFM